MEERGKKQKVDLPVGPEDIVPLVKSQVIRYSMIYDDKQFAPWASCRFSKRWQLC
jgi:hypothetical protein